MILLFDIGNTHTHLGLANDRCVLKQADLPTAGWQTARRRRRILKFIGKNRQSKARLLCSVVPGATPRVVKAVRALTGLPVLELTPKTARGVGIDYPRPASTLT